MLCPLACVVGAVVAVAPQGCGSRVLMYTGFGQGGFGEVSLCFWSWLVRRLCRLWVWAVVTLFPRRACKEGPYQDRPPLCPFRLSPLLTCS